MAKRLFTSSQNLKMMTLTMSMVADPCAQALVKVSRGKHVRLRPSRLRHPKNVGTTAQANWKISMSRRNFAHLKPLEVRVSTTSSIRELKEQIKHSVGVPVRLQQLMHPSSSGSLRPPMVVPVPLRPDYCSELLANNEKPSWPSMHKMVSDERDFYRYNMSEDSS